MHQVLDYDDRNFIRKFERIEAVSNLPRSGRLLTSDVPLEDIFQERKSGWWLFELSVYYW